MTARERREKGRPPRPKKRAAPPLWRLVVKVPLDAADLAGAVVARAGGGGAMQEETPREARITCFDERKATLEGLARVAEQQLASVGVRGACRVTRAPRAFRGWQTAWTDTLEPVRISDDTWLVPTNRAVPDIAEETIVRLEPSLAFGFGEHSTTRMAAGKVEQLCRAGARHVLDFGSGSGVLSLVAVHAGARRTVGLDVDPVAVESARKNALLNGTERQSRYSRARLAQLRSRFDVVVANVDLATLVGNAVALSKCLTEGGTLVMTGFLESDVRDVSRPFRALGLRIRERTSDSGFAMLVMRRVKSPKLAPKT